MKQAGARHGKGNRQATCVPYRAGTAPAECRGYRRVVRETGIGGNPYRLSVATANVPCIVALGRNCPGRTVLISGALVARRLCS